MEFNCDRLKQRAKLVYEHLSAIIEASELFDSIAAALERLSRARLFPLRSANGGFYCERAIWASHSREFKIHT